MQPINLQEAELIFNINFDFFPIYSLKISAMVEQRRKNAEQQQLHVSLTAAVQTPPEAPNPNCHNERVTVFGLKEVTNLRYRNSCKTPSESLLCL